MKTTVFSRLLTGIYKHITTLKLKITPFISNILVLTKERSVTIITSATAWLSMLNPRSKLLFGTASAAVIALIIFLPLFIRMSSGQITVGLDTKKQDPIIQPDDSTLRIVQATPSGDISRDDLKKEIVVVFNHPVVPLAKLEATTKGVFSIQPALAGSFRWYGSRVCAFIPKNNMSAGTTYHVEIQKGIKALNGKTLNDAYRFEFYTPLLEVLSHSLIGAEHRYYSTEKIEYNQAFKLVFNFPVSLDDVRNNLKIKSGSHTYRYRLARPERAPHELYGQTLNDWDLERTVNIIPQELFKRDSEISIIVSKNLTVPGGNRGMEKDASYSYRTYGPLEASLGDEEPAYFQGLWNYGIKFNNPVNCRDIANLIHITPAVAYRGEKEGSTSFVSLSNWEVRPSKTYKISIAKSLSDVYGNRLRGTDSFEVKLPGYRPSITTETGHWCVEARMSQKLPVEITNIKTVMARVGVFTLDHVGQDIEDNDYSIFKNAMGVKEIPWNTNVGAAEAQRLGFDFSPYLNGGKRGWIALSLTANVPNYNNKLEEQSFVQYIQSTDLGMTVKQGDRKSYVWIHSLTNGTPLKGVKVTAYEARRHIADGFTNDEGFCALTTAKINKLHHSIFVAETTNGEKDKAFVSVRNHGVYMSSLADYSDSASLPSAFGEIVFDRKLYRPGDEVGFKAIVALRRSGAIAPFNSADGSVQITISDSKGDAVFEEKLNPSGEGGAHGKLKLKKDAPVGHYNVKVNALDKSNQTITGYIADTFQVEEFRPVAFSVETKGVRDAKIGQVLNLEVTGKYLFGAPMQNASASSTIRRKATSIHVPRFGEYFFGDEILLYERSGTYDYYSSSEGKTSVAGIFHYSVPLTPMQNLETDGLKTSTPYDLEIESRVMDVDDKSVATIKSCKVFAGNVIIGINPEDAYRNYRNPFKFKLVALGNTGNDAGSFEANAVIHKEEIKSIQSRGSSGSRQTENTRTVKSVHESALQLSGTPREFVFTPTEPGSYILTVKERNGFSASRVRFYAYGGDFGGWGMYNEDTVKLIADKNEYKPGDTARILVQSPFPRARAIVTLERENVIWQKTMIIEGNGEPLNVPIKAEYLPNVFVSVMLITSRAKQPVHEKDKKKFLTEDLGVPRFRIGIVNLKVSNESRRARLDLKTDRNHYAPGDDVEVRISSEPNAEIALSVADRGVLDLVNYHFPNPLGTFYGSWPLGVQAIENRRNLILQLLYALKGNAPGGGDGEGDVGFGGFHFDSEDGTRKDFRYTAFWDPQLKTDSKGKATVRFKLPHNLTTFRVLGFASSKGKYSSHETEFQVRRPVVVQPLMPRFIRPGDELELGTVVVNQTSRSADFIVSLKAPLLSFGNGESGEIKRVVRIPSGASREVSFKATLNVKSYVRSKFELKESGPIEVKGLIAAEPADSSVFGSSPGAGNENKDRMTFQFPILEHPPREAFTIAGYTDGRISEGITIPGRDEVLGGLGSLELSLSSTALTGLQNAFDFYDTNPYICLEQRGSAFLSMVTSGKLLKSFKFQPPAKSGYDFTTIKELFLDELGSFQNSDGGFIFWKDSKSRKSSPYLTAYVSFILQIAKENGYSVNDEIYRRSMDYLANYIRRPDDDYMYNVLENFSLMYYVLAHDRKNVRDLERFLLQNEKKLSLRARGNLALGLADSRRIDNFDENRDTRRLMEYFKNRMEFTTQSVSFREEPLGPYGSSYYSGASTMGVMLRAFIKLDGSNPMIPQMVRYAIEDKSHRLWNESHGTGNLAYALLNYSKRFETPDAEYNAQITLADKTVFEHRFQGDSNALVTSKVPIEKLMEMAQPKVVHPFIFEKKGAKGRLYYRATLSYSPRLAVVEPRDEGIEIRREVFSLSNIGKSEVKLTKTDTLKRGEMYLFRITIVNPKPYFHFLITDPVPSTVELVQSNFATESANINRFIREKRSETSRYWWEFDDDRYELRDDRVVITRSYLSPGIHEFYYLGRAIVRGKASAPAAQASLMYEPEVFGRTGEGIQLVK